MKSDIVNNFPTILSIITPILGAVLYLDRRNRAETKTLDDRHREDIKEMNLHWRELFKYFNDRLDRKERD